MAVLLGSCGGVSQSAPAVSPSSANAQPSSASQSSAPAKSSAASGPALVVRYNFISKTAPYWNMYSAIDNGFFKDEGVDLQTQQVDQNTAAKAVLTGSLDIGSQPFDSIVLAKQANLVAIGSEVETPVYTLVGGKGIENASQLKGKVISSAVINSPNTTLLRKMLASAGLEQNDYQLIASGGTAERFAALSSGQVAAALLTQPFDIRAATAGYKPLIRSTDVIKDNQFTIFMTTRDWLGKNHDAAVHFLRAVIRGNQWLYDAKNRSAAEAVLQKETKTDSAVASQLYDLYIKDVKVYVPDATPMMSHLKANMDIEVETHNIDPPAPDPASYLDLGPLKEAQAGLSAK